jgi:hypothetical protein
MYTPVELDKVRNFRYGMKAISIVEKKFKKPIAKVDFDNLTMEDTATIIWAGLVHEDKNLTVEKVMDLIDEKGNLQQVMQVMSEAMSAAFGGKEEGKNE